MGLIGWTGEKMCFASERGWTGCTTWLGFECLWLWEGVWVEGRGVVEDGFLLRVVSTGDGGLRLDESELWGTVPKRIAMRENVLHQYGALLSASTSGKWKLRQG